MHIFCLSFLRYSSRTSWTSQVTFSRFGSSFLSDLYCSHSELKLVAKIRLITAKQEEGTDSRVGSPSGQGVGTQCSEYPRDKLFLHPSKII